jgi:ssRNA-specific RNase YbeY (16S rRNA maturation enzyme)
LGHDHANEAERLAMQARERELLESYVWRGPAPVTFRQEHTIS